MHDLEARWEEVNHNPSAHLGLSVDATSLDWAFSCMAAYRLGHPEPEPLDASWMNDDGDVAVILAYTRRRREGLSGALAQALEGTDHDLERIGDAPLIHHLWSTRGILAAEARRYDEAERSFSMAKQLALQRNSPTGVMLMNIGTLRIYQGRLDEAQQALTEALDANPGAGMLTAAILGNLGSVAALRGNIPEALRWLNKSIDANGPSGSNRAEAFLDRARLLLDAGLTEDALEDLRTAESEFRRIEQPARVLHVRLLRARTFAGEGVWDDAHEEAHAAHVEAEASAVETHDMADAQSSVSLLSLVADPTSDAIDLVDSRLHPDLAVDVGIQLLRNRPDFARQLLSAETNESWASAMGKVHRGTANAAIAWLDKDPDGVEAYADVVFAEALARVETIGISDLRSNLERRVRQLAQIAASVAIEFGNARRLADVIESERRVLSAPEPALDEDERRLVSAIRVRERELREIAPEHRGALEAERFELEDSLRHLRRRHVEATTVERAATISERASIHMIDVGGELFGAVFRSPGDESIVGPIDTAQVRRALLAARQVLTQNAGGGTMKTGRLIEGIRTLLAPLLSDLATTHEFIAISEPALESVPWALLTDASVHNVGSLHEHRLAWQSTTPDVGTVVLIGGPDLEFGQTELDVLRELYPDAEVVAPSMSSAGSTLEAFAHADLVHFATHGHFRSDNPLLSHLVLADGPLTFYDLLSDGRAPTRLVFSSCEIGRNAGRSATGLSSLLLTRGCRGLVANTGAANDARTIELMAALHGGVLAGDTMAAALAAAQTQVVANDPASALFSAYGAM